MRRLTILLLTVGALMWATSAIALSDEAFQVVPCAISGDAVPGTKIIFPETRSGDWSVEVDRDGRTLTSNGRATGYAFAHDGEPFRGYHLGELVVSGVGQGDGCDEDTTTTFEDTTTTQPDDDVTTTTGGDATTTTAPDDVTTTTQPGRPPRGEDCPEDQHEIGRQGAQRLCAADAEGG